MEWDRLKTFYYVAKAGSFTKASEFLNISQSAISRSVATLEDRLGARLFERFARGVVLTQQGEIMFESVQKMFEEATRAEMLVKEESEEPQGPLWIATTMTNASVWLMNYIPSFLKKYPKIRLTIIGSDEALDLRTREADVAIRPFIQDQAHLIQKYIYTFHLVLYASKEYLEEFGTPKKAADLDKHRLIVFGNVSAHPYSDINWPLRVGAESGRVREPFMCINTTAGIFQAAEAGLGITSIPEEYPGIEGSNLVRVLPKLDPVELPLYYVYPERLKNSKRVIALGEHLEEVLTLKNEK